MVAASAVATTRSTPVGTARDARLAGVAALVAGLGFAPQPLLIFLFPAPDGAEFWSPGRIFSELTVRITIQAITWGVIGAALVVLAVAAERLLFPSTWARIGTSFGVIGGAAWLAESAWRLAPLSQPAQHFAAAPVDDSTQGSVLYLLTYASFGWTALGAICVGTWLVMLGTTRSPVIGRAIRILAVILGAANVVGLYAAPTIPIAALLCQLLLVVLGIVLLVRAGH